MIKPLSCFTSKPFSIPALPEKSAVCSDRGNAYRIIAFGRKKNNADFVNNLYAPTKTFSRKCSSCKGKTRENHSAQEKTKGKQQAKAQRHCSQKPHPHPVTTVLARPGRAQRASGNPVERCRHCAKTCLKKAPGFLGAAATKRRFAYFAAAGKVGRARKRETPLRGNLAAITNGGTRTSSPNSSKMFLFACITRAVDHESLILKHTRKCSKKIKIDFTLWT